MILGVVLGGDFISILLLIRSSIFSLASLSLFFTFSYFFCNSIYFLPIYLTFSLYFSTFSSKNTSFSTRLYFYLLSPALLSFMKLPSLCTRLIFFTFLSSMMLTSFITFFLLILFSCEVYLLFIWLVVCVLSMLEILRS